jgi:RNA polymerase sigma factor (sigma-70 family)
VLASLGTHPRAGGWLRAGPFLVGTNALHVREGLSELIQEKSTTLLSASDQAEVSPRRELLARLVRRMQDGDGQALECFIQETQQVAWRLAFSLLRDRHRAEDCLQDVYFSVYRSVHQLRDPYAAQTWLLRIVTHRCRRLLRSRPAASLEELAESGVEPAAPDPTEKTRERLGMEQALARLGPQDREVLTLREMMQLSYEEIAQGLQIPLGTVRSRLAKARQRFVQALTGKGREGSR